MNKSACYSYFEIDAGDIWDFQKEEYLKKHMERKAIDELFEYLQKFIIATGCEPDYCYDEVTDESSQAFYEKHYNEWKEKEFKKIPIDFFFVKSCMFSLNQKCTINLSQTDKFDFEKLFSLKLLQYNSAIIYLTDFLDYQLKNNFQNDISFFKKFLFIVFNQNVISDKIAAIIAEWLKIERSFLSIGYAGEHNHGDVPASELSGEANTECPDDFDIKPPQPLRPHIENISDNILPGEVLQIDEEEQDVSAEPYEIKGDFSIEQIRYYFSFLCSPIPPRNWSYLKKEEVKEMFKDGLVIPARPREKKFKLFTHRGFPIKDVFYFIYIFINHNNSTYNKQKVLQFFAYYIEDFDPVLRSQDERNTFSKNIKSKISRSNNFDVTDYLPKD